MGTLTAVTLAEDTLCIHFGIQADSLADHGCILHLCLYFIPLKVPSISCTAVRRRLFELSSSDCLSPYIKHHNRAILYLATCFLRAGVSKFTVWELLMFHTHSQTSVNSQFFLGHADAERMSNELMRRWNICAGSLSLN